MDSFLKALESAAGAAGTFFGNAAQQNQTGSVQNDARQIAYMQASAAERRDTLAAQTQQANVRNLAIGAFALIALVLLMRNKAV